MSNFLINDFPNLMPTGHDETSKPKMQKQNEKTLQDACHGMPNIFLMLNQTSESIFLF
jgi:hypothetical protein